MSNALWRSVLGLFRKIMPFHIAGKDIAIAMSIFRSRRSKIALVNKQGSHTFWSHTDGESFRRLGASSSSVSLKASSGVYPSWKHYALFCAELRRSVPSFG